MLGILSGPNQDHKQLHGCTGWFLLPQSGSGEVMVAVTMLEDRH